MPEKTTQKEHGKKTAPPSEKEVQPEVVIQIPLAELHPFPDHPFQVRDQSLLSLCGHVVEDGIAVFFVADYDAGFPAAIVAAAHHAVTGWSALCHLVSPPEGFYH